MKKIIVLGGAGFIGTNLCLSALRKGLHVVVFDNLSRKGADLNLECIRNQSPDQVTTITGDIRSCEDVQELFGRHSDADAIFHFAGQVAVTTSVQDPREDFEINLGGTFNVLEMMRQGRIRARLVYSSTNKVYGALTGAEVISTPSRYELPSYPNGVSEETPLDFHSPYGCSKGAADQYVLDYSRIYGLKTVVFRQSCVYGYHQFGVEDQGWVAWFTIAVLFGLPITIYGSGKQVRDILFVSDLMDAYWAAVEYGAITNGQAYNIGGSQYRMSLLELLQYLETLTGTKATVTHAPSRAADQPVFISDIRKATRDFRWAPKVDCREGVTRLADWLAQNKAVLLKSGIIPRGFTFTPQSTMNRIGTP